MATGHSESGLPNGSVLETNKYMLEYEVAWDVQFVGRTPEGREETVRAHRYMLISRNIVFRAMFRTPLIEQERQQISLPDIHPEALRRILRYLYCEELHLDDDIVYDVLYAAKKYLMVDVTERCLQYLATNLSPQNVCAVLNYAVGYEEEGLLRKAMKVVSVSTQDVLKSDLFREIHPRTVGTILACESLNAPEEDVFRACLEWGRAECRRNGVEPTPSNVRQALGPSLYLVRFPTLPADVITCDVIGSGLLSPQEEDCLRANLDQDGVDSPCLPFPATKRRQIEIGCVFCDFVKGTSEATVLAQRGHMHTIRVNEAILLHQVAVIERRPSYIVGIRISVSQNGKCLKNVSMPVPVARQQVTYGNVIPVRFPRKVALEAGEFTVEVAYRFISTYGTVTCCVPHTDAILCNGVLCQISYNTSCQIANIGFSVA